MPTSSSKIADDIYEDISVAITRVRAIFATERSGIVTTAPTERRDKRFLHVLFIGWEAFRAHLISKASAWRDFAGARTV
jgi:hypothetical protein